jgi:molybdenum cofactor synthesis domain-containing protein
MEVVEALEGIAASPLYDRIWSSLDVVIRSIDLYGFEGLALSLNGGKDSTVLLHLIRAAVAVRAGASEGDGGAGGDGGDGGDGGTGDSGRLGGPERSEGGGGLGGMVTFFFDREDDFREVVGFTKATADAYELDMRVYSNSFFEGLEDLLGSTDVKGIFLGTRRGDPNADSQIFSPSSKGWPVFMRINPIMEWSYHDVWEFLLLCRLPYCSLYDEGYTSLGSVDTTFPNGALLRSDGKYSPAHLLTDPKLERSGRKNGKNTMTRGESEHDMLRTTPTAGLVIIGDEILKAKVEEQNCKFLLKQLRSVGWQVQRVTFVGDVMEDIATAVNDLSQKCDAVLTCGGLGPTLDDVTMKAVAQAIGRKVSTSSELEHAIRSHFGEHTTEHHLKMALVPDGPEVCIETLLCHVLPFTRDLRSLARL